MLGVNVENVTIIGPTLSRIQIEAIKGAAGESELRIAPPWSRKWLARAA